MTFFSRYDRYIASLSLNAPATRDQVASLETQFSILLPEQYIDFLLMADGGEGPMGENKYIVLYSIEALVDTNVLFRAKGYYNDFLFFASDGGGEGYAFDLRNNRVSIINIPFIGGIEYSIFCGDTLLQFLELLCN